MPFGKFSFIYARGVQTTVRNASARIIFGGNFRTRESMDSGMHILFDNFVIPAIQLVAVRKSTASAASVRTNLKQQLIA